MKLVFFTITVLFAVILIVTGSQSFTNSAPDNECFACHTNIADTAEIKLTGIPKAYSPGKTYTLTLTVQSKLKSMSEIKGGFSASTTEGELIIIDEANTQTSNSFLTHTKEGAKKRTWKIGWKSPSEKKPVEIRVMAIASNGDFSPSGDAIAAEIIKINPAK
ncbi:MAG: hypothetical protein N3A59_05655 [Thermodesulfovibrionales bacterium]|nr:hypothetical protein [Thermodesulfovibrionales bacterium]